jgi:hypothetical protein
MKYRGALMIALIVAGLGLTTCSLQREIPMTDPGGHLTEGYETVWPPEDWIFFVLGLLAFAGAGWIMFGPRKPTEGGKP